MATTYSPNLRLSLIGTGEQQGTWGGITNTNLGTLLEEAIGGYVSVAVTDGADTVLSAIDGASDQSRNMVLNLTGVLTATRNVVISSTPPVPEKLYVVKNATNFAVTFKVNGQTGVSIPSGSTYFVYVDGTDVRQINGSIASQDASNVSITGGSIVTNASSLSIRDSDGSHIMSFAVGSNLTANRVFTLTAGDAARTLDISASNVTVTSAGASLVSGADAAAQRTTLGLGTVATQNANNVSITGGSVTGITDLALADGGTGASLADPNANAILGWNDTANVMRFYTAGTGITINATSNTISSDSGLTVTTYTSGSGNFTIPAVGNVFLVRCWGGGGSGARGDGGGNRCAGGGGGSYSEHIYSLADLGSRGSNISYTVAAGGAAVSAAGSGNPGGNTTFGTGSIQFLAYGGGSGFGGGSTCGGGGGGGPLSAGGNGSATAGGTAGAGGGAIGAFATATASVTPTNWGAGGGGSAASGSTVSAGGNSFLGGGGGGGATTVTTTGGTSVIGGAGGPGVNTGGSPNGIAPGGGGGARYENANSSGAGGAGRIEIWVW
jgi:hypothetical protein